MSAFDDDLAKQLAVLATEVPPIAVSLDTVQRVGRHRRRRRHSAIAAVSFAALLGLGTTISWAGSTAPNDAATAGLPQTDLSPQVATPSPATDPVPPSSDEAPVSPTDRSSNTGSTTAGYVDAGPLTDESGDNGPAETAAGDATGTAPTTAANPPPSTPIEPPPVAPTTVPAATQPVPTGPLKVSTSRSIELSENEQIIVTGEGFAPNHAISVGQCVAFVTLEAYANCAVLGSATSDTNGRFKLSVTVHRQLIPYFGLVGADCARALCGIAASHDRLSRLQPASFAPMSFATGTPAPAPVATAPTPPPTPPTTAASPRMPSTPADAPSVSPPVTEVPPVKVHAPASDAA